MNDFYTYAYLREDGTPYYIGKGKGNRIYSTARTIPPPQDKTRIIFLKKDLTEKEAFRHEVYMIAVLGRKDLGTGILRNLCGGGEGVSGNSRGGKASAARQIKLGLGLFDSRNANKVREGNVRGCLKAAKLASKEIELTNISTKEKLVFPSGREAARSLNINQGNLTQCVLGKRPTCQGFTARYLSYS